MISVQTQTQGQIQKYSFPSNINEPKFENRRVIFMALTGKSVTKERQDVYEKFKANGESGLEDDVKGIVTLPLNENISDSQGHKWAESDYVSAISQGVEAVFEALGGGALGETMKNFFQKDSKLSKFKGIVKGAYGAINSVQVGALADAMGTRRPMINPGQFQNYQGSSLRSFKFSFTFIPENKEETQQVIEIIRFFKKCASPSLPFSDSKEVKEDQGFWGTLTSQAIMLSPCTWEIFVCNPTINKLMSFHKCVCTNVSVTYGDSEKVSMYYDGMPKQVSLSLDFAECQLQFSESYGDSDIYTVKLDGDMTDKAMNWVDENIVQPTADFAINADKKIRQTPVVGDVYVTIGDYAKDAYSVGKNLIKGNGLVLD